MRNYKKRSKYGVDQTTKGKQNRTVIDRKTEKEVCFDSLLEKRFYEDIVCAGLDSGEIVDYELQKKYKLQPSFRHNGKTIRAIDYVADFWVKYSDGSERVYDTKGGMVDPSAKIKRKLISQVWDDIGKQDLADGQNRQAALLEMMAGKNRSNILASILQHPELLTDVYNDSANNYQNSAQNELNTYLDSIEAKTTKIKESWSQLWQSEGSTNTFKGLLDIGNGAVGLLNGLGLNKSLAGVGGMLVSHAMNWGGTNYQLVL